jgi:deoxyribodipyrimidine photolyase-related protein
MTIGIWILGDQLSLHHTALNAFSVTKENISIILIESSDYVKQRPYHRQKLVLVWSAMRHFAEELKSNNWPVIYKITDSFLPCLEKWIKDNYLTELWIMQPNNRDFNYLIDDLSKLIKVKLIPNNQFFWNRNQFAQWATNRKRLLLEDFYRESRKRFQILMEKNKPVGNNWNFDKENRKPPNKKIIPPDNLCFSPDAITQEVIAWVKNNNFSDYGNLESFNWGVTRDDALKVLNNFIMTKISKFGPYQDAMVTGENTLWHSLISPYLNLGLLHPQEVVSAVENAYYENNLELNSVEGFIRQVLGWREYMYGIYHYLDSEYAHHNWFEHYENLPDFYWDSSKTKMNCLHQVLQEIEQTGYAHHIQRLMILSNFALILGVNPQEIEAWFHAVFIDSYDWVMQTNVIGMGQFADGGILASKPYAASANYINKMSDYCQNCSYNSKEKTGENACPFNYFYWDFLNRHQDKLRPQGRMNLILASLKKFSETELSQITNSAQKWRLENLTK